MSAAASSLATVALLQASQAKTAACKALVRDYEHNTATVDQQQEYAGCIGHLHPDAIGPDAAIALKVLIVLMVASIPVGAWRGYRSAYGDIAEAGIAAFLYPAAIGAAAICVFFLVLGIRFVFS